MLKSDASMTVDTTKASDSIRQAQSYRARGSIKEGLKVLEDVLGSAEFES